MPSRTAQRRLESVSTDRNTTQAAPLPEWVPARIATHYKRIHAGEDGDLWRNGPYGGGCGLLAEYGYPKSQLAPTITSLCTNPEMESVWRRLGNDLNGDRYRQGWEGQLFYYVMWALFVRSPWDPLTPSQRKKKHSEITQRLSELAAILREYELDQHIWEFIQPEEFEGAIERHYYTGFSDDYRGPDGIEGRREPGLFLYGNPPQVSDVLERLGRKISDEKVYEVALIERNNSPHGPDYVMFARRMGSYFTQHLGAPRYEIVAALARVLLGVDVDEETTKGTINSAPHDKEKMFNLWE